MSIVEGERRLDVQGLRAVAVLLVVVFHAWPSVLPGGFVGVDVFFVISGFVITLLLEREWRESGRIDLRRFYTRRVRRILPALAVTMVAVAVGCVLVMGPLGASKETAATGLAASTLWANVQLWANPAGYFDHAAEQNALLHTWSLSVEEQFYLLFPWLVVAAHRLRRVAVTLVLVAAGSLALSFATTGPFAFYWTPARAWEFIVGALVALAVPQLRRVSELVAFTLSLAGVGLVVTAAIVFNGSTAFPGVAALYPVVGAVLLLAAGSASPAGVIPTLLSLRPLVWIGDLSYGWYLWHWPAIVFGRLLAPGSEHIAVIGSLAIAWVSYRVVEQPVRNSSRLVRRRVVALAVGCVLLPAIAAAAVPSVAGTLQGDSERAMIAALTPHHADVVRRCDKYTSLDVERCTWPAHGRSRGRIVFAGDSNAGHLTEAVTAAGNQLGYDVTVTTRPGCPMVAVTILAEHGDACRGWLAATFDLVDLLNPDAVLVSSSGSLALPTSAYAIEGPDGSDGVAAWEAGIRAVLARIEESGAAPVLVHQVPHLLAFEPETCGEACVVRVDRSTVDEERHPIHDAERRAADAVGAGTIDLIDALCTPDCASYRHGRWIYRDARHLTVDASMLLAAPFADQLAAIIHGD